MSRSLTDKEALDALAESMKRTFGTSDLVNEVEKLLEYTGREIGDEAEPEAEDEEEPDDEKESFGSLRAYSRRRF